ncbi:MAG: hypothetical protein A2504_11320 [Bdellovibrionales bacterium RIFOXYD12_FULL_39_22]|nr:MAG: hypothetical protein A2385_09885 [Bdellovibrionales bacterium RIFOXYB1_FULL_39_21]OFZ44261.1 MAG: hypothetical protein A2485_07505 [Bdellovibrionales bacterium RIFOXYC12_FULL_39_17]OFZ46803.1 MAG: hypothetical protein A2404_04740 [Bdellovibrionales bacterium RIFOXYC1_FULL_39_130]OFZ70537.1 MAG: hypothetical protein A2451_13805 [Bdellovibrionales bacterium RIFOXYC2_FULL_39_8]OFZ75920.1 MAG: hypothetical protein A2560_02410 [Bdellovibrionales bacterium RIFOXYD1_FULL_39_84]OFZ95482.1 MAG:
MATIFENGNFISCDEQNTIFSVLVEDQGKIVFTGNKIPHQYQSAKKIDLQKKTVLPAFFDTHIHFSSYAFFNLGLDCRNAGDFRELQAIIGKYVAQHLEEKIVLGFGISAHTLKEKRLPTSKDLDKITSHPLLLIKYDGHAAMANEALISHLPSVVLEKRGFEKESGQFFQEAFYEVVNYISKKVSLAKIFTNLVEGSNQLIKNGIGSISSVEGVGIPFDVDLMRFAARGLPINIKTYYQTMNVQKVLRRKLDCIGGCFETALDGCFGSVDAALKEPYNHDISNKGVLYYSQEKVNSFVKEAHNSGLQMALHAIGDAAIEQALNAFETALRENPRKDHRHTIIHAELMDEKLIARVKKLGICIALQTPFLHWELEPMEYLQSILGQRTQNFMPLKSMLAAGILLAGGSDGPTTLPNPIWGIHSACNHPNSAESVEVMDAIKMHTIAGAKISFMEKTHGSLQEGKYANFVILSENILQVEKHHIRDIKIEATFLRGKLPKNLSGNNLKYVMDCLIKNKD